MGQGWQGIGVEPAGVVVACWKGLAVAEQGAAAAASSSRAETLAWWSGVARDLSSRELKGVNAHVLEEPLPAFMTMANVPAGSMAMAVGWSWTVTRA